MKHVYAFSPLLLAAALMSAPASAGDASRAQASANPQAAQWTGVFTGRHVNGAPVYRFPSVTVIADRKALANEAPVYRLLPITVVAERKTPATRTDGKRPEGELQARAKPSRPPA